MRSIASPPPFFFFLSSFFFLLCKALPCLSFRACREIFITVRCVHRTLQNINITDEQCSSLRIERSDTGDPEKYCVANFLGRGETNETILKDLLANSFYRVISLDERVFPLTTLLYSLFSLHYECREFTTPPSRIRVPPPLTSGGMKRFVDYYPSVAFGDSSPHNGSR